MFIAFQPDGFTDQAVPVEHRVSVISGLESQVFVFGAAVGTDCFHLGDDYGRVCGEYIG